MKEEETKERAEEKIAQEITADFIKRREERKEIERGWQLNLEFIEGRQYKAIDYRGEIFEIEREFFWQERGVYNHIAPLIESRLARLSKIEPIFSIRQEGKQNGTAKQPQQTQTTAPEITDKEKTLAKWLINGRLKSVLEKGTLYSESLGTAFYKVIYNGNKGEIIGEIDNKPIHTGGVEIIAVSPFEIFPDSIYREEIEECESIIQAKQFTKGEIKAKYGIDLDKGEKENKGEKKEKGEEQITVIERYAKPTKENPNGSLIVVAKDKILYQGEMPYQNGTEGKRTYPFIKQECIKRAGKFFGGSIVERLIPVQRAYNAVKNRKQEFLNRLSTGVMNVEEGSIDTEDLALEGLPPGKILVYRQGATPPQMLKNESVPEGFEKEEESLLNEFINISGISQVSSSMQNASVTSGTALEILVEQDSERLIATAEKIRNSALEIAKMTMRLYAEFTPFIIGEDGEIVEIENKDAERVYIENENELLYTETQKKEMILKLYESGILTNQDGKVEQKTKQKLLAIMGYKDII